MNKVFNHIHFIDSNLRYCGCGCGLWWSDIIREKLRDSGVDFQMDKVISTSRLP